MALTEQDFREIFVDRSGLLTSAEFDVVQKNAEGLRRPLSQVLMERTAVSPRYFLELVGDFFSLPVTELKIAEVDREALTSVSQAFAEKHLIVPFAKDARSLKVAFADPRNRDVVAAVESTAGVPIAPYAATEQAIRRALLLYRGDIREHLRRMVKRLEKDAAAGESATGEVPSILAFLDAIVDTAVILDASDIHIEPFEQETIIRLRVDGLLRTVARVPKVFHDSLIARLKVLARLRIDEHRLPQDGRFNVRVQEQAVDIRLSLVPSYWGEKAAMRVLRKEASLFDLASLGLLESDLEIIVRHLKRPFGMILVCGPTGSGKTTTLYAFLQEIGVEKTDVVNISTVEDPIEYTVARVTQIQIHPEINLTFSVGLRALLRQDPDILMVGEIRDGETANTAVRAALIGRLLLSSLHTNSAVGAIPRLLDMGVEPYLVSSTLSLVVAQRLVRKLCVRCRESYAPSNDVLGRLRELPSFAESVASLKRHGLLSDAKDPFKEVRFFQASGCAHCDHTGYQGRTPLFEILEVTDALRPHITARRDAAAITEVARQEGMKTLFADGLAKVAMGVTDLDELMRVAA